MAVLLEVVVVSEKKSPPGIGLGKPGRWSSRWSLIAGIGAGTGAETGTGAEPRMYVTGVSPYSKSPVEPYSTSPVEPYSTSPVE